MPDSITLQTAIWWAAIAAVVLIVCIGVVAYHFATSWAERAARTADASTQESRSRQEIAKLELQKVDTEYKLALLQHQGPSLEDMQVHISQQTLDQLALDELKTRIKGMKARVVVEL